MKIISMLAGTLARAGRKLPAIWKSGRMLFKSSKAKVAGKWFWRALELGSVGALVYDMAADDQDPESIAQINDMIMDVIANPTVVCAINTPFQDQDAVISILAKNGVILSNQGGLDEIYGMSCVICSRYLGEVSPARFYYSFEDMRTILTQAGDMIVNLYKDVLAKAGAEEGADTFVSFIKELKEEDLEFVFRKNLDYIAYFFETLVIDAGGEGVESISNTIYINPSNKNLL